MDQRNADAHAIGNGDTVDTVELAPHGEELGVADLGRVELAGAYAQHTAVGVDAADAFATGGRDFAAG